MATDAIHGGPPTVAEVEASAATTAEDSWHPLVARSDRALATAARVGQAPIIRPPILPALP
jgi:hypothetical protein